MRVRPWFLFSRVAVSVTVAAALFAAVGPAGAAPSAKPKSGGTLKFFFAVDPPGMDPIQLREVPQITPAVAATSIFDELVYTDPDTNQVKPKIATSLTTSDKGTTWTLKLHPNVRFSDGTPYDAAAVMYNWQRIADPVNKVVFAAPAQEITTYAVVDPQTLKVTLKAPDPLWDQYVARNLSTIGSPTALKADAKGFQTKPVAAGPFLLKDWVRGVSLTLVRNPDYWQKGKPYIDELDYMIVSDDAARLGSLNTGAVQASYEGQSWGNVEQLKTGDKYKIVETPSFGGGASIVFNMSKPPFSDIRLRQAVSLVLDSSEMVDRLNYGDKDSVITTIDREDSPYYNPKIKLAKPDPAAAQKLVDAIVAEQGGKPIEFTYLAINTPYHVNLGQTFQSIMQTRLKNVNVKIDVQSSTTAIPREVAGDYQVASQSPAWSNLAIDMPAWFRTGGTLNYMRYSNPSIDAVLDRLVTVTDPKAIQDIYNTVIGTVLKDVPVVWIARFRTWWAFDKSTVTGWKMFYNQRPLLEDVWLKSKNT